MNKPKISVILPVYNVEPYIEECLDSILEQSMIDDLEVIMVDDGSSDNSRYAIERYALDYENFHAYHKENEGSGIARNYGLELAKGEYIHFCDPDDYIKPDFYEKIYGLAKSSPKSDFVVVNSIRFGNFHIWEGILYKNAFENITEPIHSTSIKENASLVWDTGVWNKLIKKEFLDEKNIRFPNENIVSQDLVFTIKLHYLANEIAIDPNIYYYWRFRQSKTSVTQQKGKIKSFTDRLRVIELISRFFKEKDVEKEIIDREYDKWLNHDLKDYIKRIDEYPLESLDEKLLDVKNILKDTPEHIKENLNSYKQISYKMIENDDVEGLLSFGPLEGDLKKNPKLFEIAGENYKQYVNLIRDGEKEELQAKRESIDSNDKEISIDFSSYIPFVDGEDFKISASIVSDENKEYPIITEDITDSIEEPPMAVLGEETPKEEEIEWEITELQDYSIEKDKRLIIPLNLIKNLKHSRIKIKYEGENLSKETFLKNNRRKTLVFEDFDVDIGVGIQKELYIDIRYTNNNRIIIQDIIKDDSKFIIVGSCEERIENLKIKNIVNFTEKTFPMEYLSHEEIIGQLYGDLNEDLDDENQALERYEYEFISYLPFKELMNDVIKKWEIGTDGFIDNIRLSKNFYYYTSTHQIPIRNLRNKIVLECSLIDIVTEMHEGKEEIIEIRNQNKELKKEIKGLKKENKRAKKDTKKLKEKNKELNREKRKLDNENKKLNKEIQRQKKLINDYKNRKVVKIVDNMQNIH